MTLHLQRLGADLSSSANSKHTDLFDTSAVLQAAERKVKERKYPGGVGGRRSAVFQNESPDKLTD
ncbi:hypothetical protein NQZ68_007643 [Dissostichus eleginoides]|nr:hypothetical protein NQZ68_007643 [Dissostichus eleginoides]